MNHFISSLGPKNYKSFILYVLYEKPWWTKQLQLLNWLPFPQINKTDSYLQQHLKLNVIRDS